MKLFKMALCICMFFIAINAFCYKITMSLQLRNNTNNLMRVYPTYCYGITDAQLPSELDLPKNTEKTMTIIGQSNFKDLGYQEYNLNIIQHDTIVWRYTIVMGINYYDFSYYHADAFALLYKDNMTLFAAIVPAGSGPLHPILSSMQFYVGGTFWGHSLLILN